MRRQKTLRCKGTRITEIYSKFKQENTSQQTAFIHGWRDGRTELFQILSIEMDGNKNYKNEVQNP